MERNSQVNGSSLCRIATDSMMMMITKTQIMYSYEYINVAYISRFVISF